MIPEYFNYLLTGEKASEYTNAITTQLVSPETKDWDYELIENVRISKTDFPENKEAGNGTGKFDERNSERGRI